VGSIPTAGMNVNISPAKRISDFLILLEL